jgi:glutamine cyclotransferase
MKLSKALISIVILSFCFLAACSDNPDTPGSNPPAASITPAINFSVSKVYPHDTGSFTEGLGFYNGKLWESTGLEGRSFILQTDLATGKVEKRYPLDSTLFGEGIVVLHDTLYQLTWKNHRAFAYDFKSMKLVKEFTLQPEGWGMTTDSTVLIASDGTSNLYFYESGSFRLLHTQSVTENGSLLPEVNELEWVNGMIYANLWTKERIVRIDPATGFVTGSMDISQLTREARLKNPSADVANGIAYNPETKKFYVTGKNWPNLYELQFNF